MQVLTLYKYTHNTHISTSTNAYMYGTILRKYKYTRCMCTINWLHLRVLSWCCLVCPKEDGVGEEKSGGEGRGEERGGGSNENSHTCVCMNVVWAVCGQGVWLGCVGKGCKACLYRDSWRWVLRLFED